MYSFPNLQLVRCSMTGPNCCFLTYIQTSQVAGKMAWYSHLFKNFPVCSDPYTVKGFSVVSEAKVDIFLEFSCFYYDPRYIDSLISGSSAFSKSSLNIWSSQFMYCWSVAWRICSITLLACAAAAVAKSLQSCPTLCNPIDGSPPGSPVPGILQAGTLEWLAISLLQCMKVKSEIEVAQSCLTLSDPMDCSLPGSSVHGIFQARVLEWGAIAFSLQ